MFIETQATPNPATVKFLPGRAVMPSGTIDFSSPEAAEASPLATALFSLGDVTGVFLGSDFISVTRAEGGSDWRELKPQVLGIIVDHFASGAPLLNETAAAEDAIEDDSETADIVAQIKDLLETRIRPAVANDGGDIIYKGFREGIVYLQMQGACAGCPSSTATLKNGIENLLKYYVPEVTDVRAV
ncbi:NifU family protein [Sphingosinicella microcystinivorans]|uniref:Fe-S cluster biogenesis protein NfuA n=1 Tax=Sphingosinicella microcystinivorans TaxID=335406 RepID=A0AAD1D3D0_SPHMI|nr:NifU family protein [Sphingosinicella microcystinivorans]RKS89233.1 Fe-S cluster biogenesis protein NfuA [Sphingosinicella microcystinivorans]BBE32991.1 iron transporter [Sphingosinicella microcystinivorans]